MDSGSPAREYRRRSRLYGNRHDSGVMRLQALGHTCKGAAGTHTGHKNIDCAIGVAPYLFGGRAFVYGRIGRIFELLQDDRSRMLVA